VRNSIRLWLVAVTGATYADQLAGPTLAQFVLTNANATSPLKPENSGRFSDQVFQRFTVQAETGH
jgi:hypothetical protein